MRSVHDREPGALVLAFWLLVLGAVSPGDVSASPDGPAGQRVEEGRYCYSLEGKTLTAGARVEVTEHGDVAAWLEATVHDDANAYYTAYSQEAAGYLGAGPGVEMAVTTWIEYDVQDGEESWTLTEERLVTPQGTLLRVDCEHAVGFSNAWSVEGDTGYPWHYRRVRFDPAASATIVRRGVVRGERDIYLLRAREGQVLTLWIDALEDNAVFDLVAPDGTTLREESLEERVVLPVSGEYEIRVGGTRGNASYELVIALR